MQQKAGISYRSIITVLMLISTGQILAQRFFNLTVDEVKIDSILPTVSYSMPLPDNYDDSVYIAKIKYAEYIDMPQADIDMYNKVSGAELPESPVVNQTVITSNKKASMLFCLSPLVYRNGKYQILASYMLDVQSEARILAKGIKKASKEDRYAEHSVLATGRWAKISVAESGFHELTDAVIRQAGFRDISKVKIYGYGGNLVPEVLTDAYLRSTDDLAEVPSALVNGKRIFYGNGPVSWNINATERIRNPYSNYGYYFITENEEEPLILSTEELISNNYPAASDFHTLHEIDNYAWYHGGRNLFEGAAINDSKTYKLTNPSSDTNGSVTISISAATESSFSITLNDKAIGNGNIKMSSQYDKANIALQTIKVTNLQEENNIVVKTTKGGPLRLDYLAINTPSTPKDAPDFASAKLPSAQYVYNITNQDHHADKAVDLTILIPTSQLFKEQAERLKAHHESHDGMTVRIVPADELYNEFSSGTPDVSAYRRYMKMMYDRATTEAEQPRYLLLFGDCVWDNRLLTADTRQLNADNLLLCHESENSWNAVSCYVSDDFIAILDDNEALTTGSNNGFTGTPDIGIGRFPVYTEDAAKNVVDKTINYAVNANVGAWQNTIMFMGDDGNGNLHMEDENNIADLIIKQYPGYNVRKIMWDAFKRTESATGVRYPDVEDAIKAQQQSGALLMNYAGHGAATSISHEYVLNIGDFEKFNNKNLPMWLTASCDIGPYDGMEETIGETILNNTKGGGIGFFGTTRTVYANYNKHINSAFTRFVLGTTNGKRNTLGDANRLAKTYVIKNGQDNTVNKFQYVLLADPALALNTPQYTCVVDEINGAPVSSSDKPMLKANSKASIKGHVEFNGVKQQNMNGLVSILVRDNEELTTCLMNDKKETTSAFVFKNRTKSLYTGTDNVSKGEFEITFTVPRDINYSNQSGLITLFAYKEDASITAHGETSDFLVGGTEDLPNDSIGPSIYCYLNSPSFVNGGEVNATPYFVAQIKDKDGINVSGSGIGHDLQLVIDNQAAMSFNLNDNFQYDLGDYTSGTTSFSIPQLTDGNHTLRFRAWDILNNVSTTTLSFKVVSSQKPTIVDVNATANPAKVSTSFIATHDRPGSEVIMTVEIFDMSGRLLHSMSQATAANSSTAVMEWDLKTSNGNKLQTGVYLYRVNVSGAKTAIASKAKKLVIINN